MNIRAAIIHIIGDIVQSIGVVIAALIIYFYPDAHIADPICTLIFTVLCIFTTVPIFKDCMSVLMEATPSEIDVVACFEDILNIDEVDEIHDFHVWALSAGKLSMSAHMRSSKPHKALKKATAILRDKYSIFHTTIQTEKSVPSLEIGCCDNDHASSAEKHDHHGHDHGHDHGNDDKK